MNEASRNASSESAAQPAATSSPDRSTPIAAEPPRRKRASTYLHARPALPLAVACAVALLAACGTAEAEPDAAGAATPSAETARAAPSDPCSLIPVAEWVEHTGYTDIQTDRSAGNTCDYLSDDLWGVLGSVILPGRAMMENPPKMAGETEPIADLGDEAFWLSLGPIFRVGETVIWITVHPTVENQRAVGIALARIAIDNL